MKTYKEYIEYLKIWLAERTEREQVFFLLVAIAITYFFWSVLLERPFINQQKVLLQSIDNKKAQLMVVTQQKNTIIRMVSKNSYADAIEKQKALTQQTAQFKERLKQIIPTLLSAQNLPQVMKSIFSQQQDVVTNSLKNLPEQPWIPEGFKDAEIPAEASTIKQLGFQMEFRSQYFNTVNYLERLDKLPWHIYWDTLEYTVQTYPEANVNVTFHVLASQSTPVRTIK